MQSLAVMLQLGGAVALLLFGLRLVRDGATEAFGMRLKVALGLGTRTTPRAFFAGLVATLALQSSTATALLTASFAERGMIRGSAAQVVLIGANVGTALTAWVIVAGLEAAAPALLLIGYLLRRRADAVWSGLGNALVGVGLMLLSLALIGQASAPLRVSPAIAAFFGLLGEAWPVAFLMAAALAAVCSSSLAVVMLVYSIGIDGGLTPALVVVMVLGANLGGAVPPVLATLRAPPAARRVAVGNLVARGIGCLVAVPFADAAAGALLGYFGDARALPVEVHLAFNLLLALAILPLAAPLARLIERFLPDLPEEAAAGTTWLDESALRTPALALAGASREVLAVGDIVERMLTLTSTAFNDNNPTPLAEVHRLENRIDRLQQEVKTYLSRLGNQATEEERQRSIVILDYVINLEHIGDIVDRGLAAEVHKKIAGGLRFSEEGYRELEELFLITLENMRVAQTIFLSRDRQLARHLMEVKVEIRRMERASAKRHLRRLRDGLAESLQTSSLHLDLLRDLKRVNAHIVSVAHPILDEEGLLIETRLRAGSTS